MSATDPPPAAAAGDPSTFRLRPVGRAGDAAAWLWARLPGLALCLAVAAASVGLQTLEHALLGRAWVEALVIAILLGAAVRTAWTPPARFRAGIGFSAKLLLEIAIVLLGASLSARALAALGPRLVFGTVALVAASVAVSYAISRGVGLPHRLAWLVACGNSICGNSAIAAVAPVIGADGEEIAASIGYTAVLGVGVVLGLPLLGALLHLRPLGFGAVAGLTVYAVPQVLAAAAPLGPLAVQMGTMVKLVRVLMLGPVCVAAALLAHDRRRSPRPRLAVHRVLPWFIVGFLAVAVLRQAGAIPSDAVAPMGTVAGVLTIVAMAALGLGVDVRSVGRAGPRVTLAVTLSLAALAAGALALVALAGL